MPIKKIYSSSFFNALYNIYFYIIRIAEKFVNYDYNNKKKPNISLQSLRNYNKNRIKGPKKIICNAPFINAYINNKGDVLPCCKTVFNSFGNIKQDDFYTIWNGSKAQNFRNRILNYELAGGCESCKYSIDSGNNEGVLAKIYDQFLPIKSFDYPQEITFELSNVCNLECVMCQGEFSHLIRKNREGLPAIPIINDNSFMKNLKPFLDKLKTARFVGGEPFLIEIYYEIWDYLLENNKNCKINILTNGTVLNNRVKNLLEKGNIKLSVSIDAFDKLVYDKIRINADFDKVYQNLCFFLTYNNKRNNTLNINYCIMNNNWDQLMPIMDFCQQNNCSINILSVEQPENRSMRYLKPEKIQGVIDYYESNIPRYKRQLVKPLNDIVNLLKLKIVESKQFESQIIVYESNAYESNLSTLKDIYKEHIVLDYNNVFIEIESYLSSLDHKNKILARYLTEITTWYENLGLLKVENTLIISKTKIRFNEINKELNNPNTH